MSSYRTDNRIFLQELLEIADEGVVVHDSCGKIIFCNPAAASILRLTKDSILDNYCGNFEPAAFREDGTPFPADEHPASVTLKTGQPCRKVVMGIEWSPELPLTWLSISSAVIPSAAPGPLMVVAMFTDITRHVEAKHQLQKALESLEKANRALTIAQSFMRGLLDAIPDRIWMKDPNGAYLFCNAALAKVYNVTESALIGKTDYEFWPRELADSMRQSDVEAVIHNKAIKIETMVSDGNCKKITMEAVKVPIRDESGALLGVFGIARDVTRHIEEQEKLQQANAELRNIADAQLLLARTDPLTGLPNRRAFEEAIDPAFQRRARRNSITSLLMIDIDRFKHVNDEFGHEAGDAALISLAKALRANSRAHDLPARLGGDEFALLLPNTKAKDASTLAFRLREEIERTEIEFGDKRFSFSISVGVASFRERDLAWSAAVKRADKGLYKAKSAARV